ncbi:MAG: hypothetical protein HY843_02505, partial [Bdellovibrio sp.]|nr:hypothetical protein [Bdellovibrio sp.]
DLITKKTAFGLYRSPKGSKRAIMPGNSGTIEKAIKLAPATDFPIIIANDDYYGGLGGRYAITTRSIRSGTMVLRHELGHNFGEVGEEYDGGQIYTGANHSDTAAVPWKHWVDGEVAVSQASYLSGAYVWQNLSNQNVRVEFDFPSKNTLGDPQFNAIISSVGWQTPQDVDVYLDNQKVSINGAYTDDRSFFEIDHLDKTLVPGKHVLEFKENIHDGNNILAFAMLYATPANYDFTKDKIGAFNTFYSPDSPSGFRPTHNTCLMREMRSVEFCSVDKENMWIRFLNRVSLIDELGVNGNEKLVYLKTPELSGLQLRWYQLKANQEPIALHDLDGLKQWSTHNMSAGKYRVEVEFKTPEVRNYTNSFRVTRDISF